MFRCPRRRGPIGTPPRVGTIGTFTRGLFRCSDAPRRVPYRCLKCALCGRKSPHGRNQKAKHRRQRPQPRLRLRRRSRNPVVLPERRKRLPAGCPRPDSHHGGPGAKHRVRLASVRQWPPCPPSLFLSGVRARQSGHRGISFSPQWSPASWAVLLPGARNSQRLSLDRITAALAAARAG
jgi:hypothetical protein